MLERGPIKKAVKLNQVCAYKYEGFWHCIDTKRDKDLLEELLQKKLNFNESINYWWFR